MVSARLRQCICFRISLNGLGLPLKSIINLASPGEPGHHPGSELAGVSISTKVLAEELRLFGVWVNCIAPGVIFTRFIRDLEKPQVRNQDPKDLRPAPPRGHP